MSINGIPSSGWFLPLNQSNLSEETKKKLRELGIDPSTVSSEAQAKALIASILQKLAVQQTVNNTSSKNVCTGELEVLNRAKDLAIKMGVSISNSTGTKEIIDKLTAALNSQTQKTKDGKEFENELNSIKNDYESLTKNQSTIFTAMNITASLNKLKLGL
ncbi:hypothetical protein HDR58_05165 [bacterium]|nr:hypothetical protein [bacterium]